MSCQYQLITRDGRAALSESCAPVIIFGSGVFGLGVFGPGGAIAGADGAMPQRAADKPKHIASTAPYGINFRRTSKKYKISELKGLTFGNENVNNLATKQS